MRRISDSKKSQQRLVRKSERPVPAKDAEAANFKGPNTRKQHRKPDEIYGDVSIPDSARKE